MELTLDPSGATPIYQQIAEQIQRRIALGAVRPGDPLPSVRQLALELTINPNTVARAYLELEYQGILDKRQGQGTFVSATAKEAASREGGRIVAGLLRRAVMEAATFGMSRKDVEALFQETVRGQLVGGGRR